MKPIEAGKVRAGDPVLARVDLAWTNASCTLREGAILKGRIVAQSPKQGASRSELAIVFESGQCGGREMKSFPLTVAAVLAPDPNRGQSLYGGEQSPPLSSATGLGLGQEGTGSPMRSMLAAAQTVLLEPPVNRPPVMVLPGQVIGLGKVQLAVGSGQEGASVLSCEKHNLRLESGVRLVLVPTVVAAATSSTSPSGNPGSVAAGESSPAVAADLGDEPDACAADTCGEEGNQDLHARALPAATVLSVASLGFAENVDREMYDLDHAETVAYLGPKRLLLTFNPHRLMSRTGNENRLPKLHIVHAVLIDIASSRVIRTLDWRVHDAAQYLWPAGDDGVLVHAGGELRAYSPDLRIEHSLSLNGPLAFVRPSPLGHAIAVGVIRERHPESVHRELAEAEGHEPEEDVEIKVLDSAFNLLVDVVRSSQEAPPILSDDGEIRLTPAGKGHWGIAEYTWTGQKRILRQVHSACRPQAESPAPHLLLITGCDRLQEVKWFRLLRSDGHAVLRGRFSSSELPNGVQGIGDSGLLAFGTTELTKSVSDSEAFHSSDLRCLRVSIYRIANGKRLAAVTVPDPLPTVQSFALAPDGHQLAILNRSQLLVYPLPGEGGANP